MIGSCCLLCATDVVERCPRTETHARAPVGVFVSQPLVLRFGEVVGSDVCPLGSPTGQSGGTTSRDDVVRPSAAPFFSVSCADIYNQVEKKVGEGSLCLLTLEGSLLFLQAVTTAPRPLIIDTTKDKPFNMQIRGTVSRPCYCVSVCC